MNITSRTDEREITLFGEESRRRVEKKVKNCFPVPFRHFVSMLYYSNSDGKRDVAMYSKGWKRKRSCAQPALGVEKAGKQIECCACSMSINSSLFWIVSASVRDLTSTFVLRKGSRLVCLLVNSRDGKSPRLVCHVAPGFSWESIDSASDRCVTIFCVLFDGRGSDAKN
jgi:hypothetical protein